MMSLLKRYLAAISGRHVRRQFMQSRAGETLLELKAVCRELIEDVAAAHRQHADHAIREARHSRDVWNMRSALFGSIALSFGEREARERLARLDDLLR
jgi:acyl-CoA reductase-like NAD-dependent aldehyde dehydrogenase